MDEIVETIKSNFDLIGSLDHFTEFTTDLFTSLRIENTHFCRLKVQNNNNNNNQTQLTVKSIQSITPNERLILFERIRYEKSLYDQIVNSTFANVNFTKNEKINQPPMRIQYPEFYQSQLDLHERLFPKVKIGYKSCIMADHDYLPTLKKIEKENQEDPNRKQQIMDSLKISDDIFKLNIKKN